MFREFAESRKSIGDVDVLYHDGLYHLFHLVLPNHDFIAHAVSTNGINWRRVENALFIGHPGSWDDLMLWTMHVSPDPHRPNHWRMFYTGLSRRDRGLKQRIGMAISDNLYQWRKAPVCWEDHRGPNDPELVKRARQEAYIDTSPSLTSPLDPSSSLPLEPDPRYYESSLDTPRNWVSFRDPFYCRHEGQGWLLASARVNCGPLVRRGCVARMEEVSPHVFEAYPPLHHPELYDDIEVPNVLIHEGHLYLIGSIREDAKIRYWHTESLDRPWKSFYDNVLLARGNYAARICRDDRGWLLWNFFSRDIGKRTMNNLLPPPKRLGVDSDGMLWAHTFEGLDDFDRAPLDVQRIVMLKATHGENFSRVDDHRVRLTSEGRFQAVAFEEPVESFRFRALLELDGMGKCGLIFRVDPESHDGYYVSLDLLKGVAQMRVWGTNPNSRREDMIRFETLQTHYWFTKTPGRAAVQLLAFGSYLELSVDGRVLLSLADQTYDRGLLGVYVETAKLLVSEIETVHLRPPMQSDEHLTEGPSRSR